MTEQVTPYDTTTAPVPSGDAGISPASVSLSSPAIGAHIPEPARFPSHADEADHLLGIRQDSADRIGSYIADLRADNITKTCDLIVAHATLVEIRGYCESLRQQLPAMSMRQIEASLNELVATLRKAVGA